MLAIGAGVVLAASAGLRAFMPLLGAGLAGRFLDWPLSSGMSWLASDSALIMLGVAAVLELAADKVPVVDNLLDAGHTVAGPIAGMLVTFTALGDLPTPLALILGLAVGAPVAGGVHAVAAATRFKSTVTSAGSLNPALSIAEDGLSIGAILVAVLVPILAFVVAVIVLFVVARVIRRMRRPVLTDTSV